MNKLEFHNKKRKDYIYSVDEVSGLLRKVKDMFLDSVVMLGGSLATYHSIKDISVKTRYGRTMEEYDIDIFVLEKGGRRLATYVFNQLITTHLNCVDLEKPGDPSYYMMKGIRKIYSLHSGDYNRKVNIVVLNGDLYSNKAITFISKAMGHTLAVCGFEAPLSEDLKPKRLVANSFTTSIETKVVRYKTTLLNTNALTKLFTRASALGFTTLKIN